MARLRRERLMDSSVLRLKALSLLSETEKSRVCANPGLRRLFALLDDCQPGRFPSEEEAARRALCSRATLKRHLSRAVGLSYRHLRQRLLMRVAARTLADPAVPIKSAATALGYRSSRAFDRAFGRWYGQSPRDFRTAPRVRDAGWERAKRSTD